MVARISAAAETPQMPVMTDANPLILLPHFGALAKHGRLSTGSTRVAKDPRRTFQDATPLA